MPQIILTPEQMKLYNEATSRIEICDTYGKVLGMFTPDYSAEFIKEQKRRAASPGPWYSGDDIQAMFRMLEETWSKEGSFDDTRLKQLLDDFDAQHGQRF